MSQISQVLHYLNTNFTSLGFVLVIFAGLIKLLKPAKMSGPATERLFNLGFKLAFVLGVLIILLGFAKDFMRNKSEPTPTPTTITVEQKISGTNNAAITAGGDVNINSDKAINNQKKQNPVSDKKAGVSMSVKQDVKGENNKAISAGGDINVNE